MNTKTKSGWKFADLSVGDTVILEDSPHPWLIIEKNRGWLSISRTDEDGTEITTRCRAKQVVDLAETSHLPEGDVTAEFQAAMAAEAESDDPEADEEEELHGMARTLDRYRPRYKDTVTAAGSKSKFNGDLMAQYLEGRTLEGVYAIGATWLPGFDMSALLEKYSHLNPGQQRMNIGNRLRSLWKKGEIVIVNGQLKPKQEEESHGGDSE